MDNNETTLALMPSLLREAVEVVTSAIEADVYFNAHRSEALIWYVDPEEGKDTLICVTYYPETGATYTSETPARFEWETGFTA